jgi:threonine dehydrogenase-like Zn-dependent dehydrogenase
LRLDRASEFAADICIAVDKTTPDEGLEAVLSHTGGRGADIFMESQALQPPSMKACNLSAKVGGI